MKITLTPTQRRELRAQAHPLAPVVMIGDNGLTPTVIAEITLALKVHELIKVRASTDDRAQREIWFNEIAESLDAAPVQHIGKILVLWKHNPAKVVKAPQKIIRAKPRRLTKREEEAIASGQKPRPAVRARRKPAERS